jgi:hypothetical protein
MDSTFEPKTTVKTQITAGVVPIQELKSPADSKENLTGSDTKEYVTGWSLRLLTGALMLGMFLVGVDSSIIGVVTPKITTSFHAMDDIAWYGSGYMLPHTVLQPTFGSFYKMFNVKAVYLASIAVFESQ